MPGSRRFRAMCMRRTGVGATWSSFSGGFRVPQFLKRRRSVPNPASFDYAILRVVPRVERQEFINAGVVAFCLEKKYLAARIHLDEERLRALWPDADAELAREHLEAVRRICEG